MTGEGIGQALLTGVLAAEAIIGAHRRGPTAVRNLYETKMRREFFADHRMSQILGRVLQNEFLTRGVLRVANYSDWTRRNFVRWMFEDEPRAALLTPRRWHRKFLKRRGAFETNSTVPINKL
jgi:flavin-dependent dehydrogenase